jgi:hypothetical protein
MDEVFGSRIAGTVAMDFFTVETVGLTRLYVPFLSRWIGVGCIGPGLPLTPLVPGSSSRLATC